MKYAQEFFAAIGGIISWLVGGWSILLTALLILNAFDFISGMAANWGQISSKRGYEGIVKKGMMWVWIWIVVANLIYLVLNHQGLDVGEVIPNAVAILIIGEGLFTLSIRGTTNSFELKNRFFYLSSSIKAPVCLRTLSHNSTRKTPLIFKKTKKSGGLKSK